MDTKKWSHSEGAKLQRMGKTTKVHMEAELNLLNLVLQLQKDFAEHIALEQEFMQKQTKWRARFMDSLTYLRRKLCTDKKAAYLKRGEALEKQRTEEVDPSKIEAFGRKIQRMIQSKEKMVDETATESDKIMDILRSLNEKDVSSKEDELLFCSRIKEMDCVIELENSSPMTSPKKKKTRPHSVAADVAPLGVDMDDDLKQAPSIGRSTLAEPGSDQTALGVSRVSQPKSMPSSDHNPTILLVKDGNDEDKKIEIEVPFVSSQPNFSNFSVTVGDDDNKVQIDVPLIDLKSNGADQRPALTETEKELIGDTLYSITKRERNTAIIKLVNGLGELYSNASERTLRRCLSHSSKGKKQLSSKLGPGFHLSDKYFIQILKKILKCDVDVSLPSLNGLIKEGMQGTSMDVGKGRVDRDIPIATLKRYQEAFLVSMDATVNSQWNSEARRAAVESIRNFVTFAALLGAVLTRGRPEFDVDDDFASANPVRPSCIVNMDPTILCFNLGMDGKLVLHVKHKDSNRAAKQADAGKLGSHTNIQSVKVTNLH